MTDTIEAVARAIANASADVWENRGVCTHPSTWYPEAQAAIASHTKALIEGAGELGEKLERNAAEHEQYAICPELVRQATATIAALRAEIERLRREGAQADE